MRDRIVLYYILLLIVQLPFYYLKGKDPILFDVTVKQVEKRLKGPVAATEKAELEEMLDRSESILSNMNDQTSRLGRLEVNRGVLAWKTGKAGEAVRHLMKAQEVFRAHHGAKSFHVAAVDLRIGELLLLRNQHKEALAHFARSWQRVSEYLGDRNPFVVRMRFRQVTCLVSLGQLKEGAKLAERHLIDLYTVATEQDRMFLRRTGSALDLLTNRGLFKQPPEGSTWRAYLGTLGKESPSSDKFRQQGD